MAPVFILFLHKCLYLGASPHTLVTTHKYSCLACTLVFRCGGVTKPNILLVFFFLFTFWYDTSIYTLGHKHSCPGTRACAPACLIVFRGGGDTKRNILSVFLFSHFGVTTVIVLLCTIAHAITYTWAIWWNFHYLIFATLTLLVVH